MQCFTEERREIVLGDFEIMMEGNKYYDVSPAPQSGHLLVARVGGLDVVNAENGDLVKSLKFEHKAFTIELHEDIVLVAVDNETETMMTLVTLDHDLKEINRWSTSLDACDFTMLNNKIYVTTGAGRVSRDIEVFTKSGEKLSSFMWNGCVGGIKSIPPDSIVYVDSEQHTVYKRRMAPGVRDFEWTTHVKAPHFICVDSNGLIWIRSNPNDCLTILNRDGK